MPYNEEDTKLHLITPALQRAGWRDARITMEFPITAGQIVLQGDGHRQLAPKKADYLLRYAESLPIAVVEAKDETHTSGGGLQQAKQYAEMLGVLFAYSSNGHGLEEWDFTTNSQRSLSMGEMPSPEELWRRYSSFKELQTTARANPLLHPYWRDPVGKKRVRYYQDIAVNRVIEQILTQQKRLLINLATGTGKTFIAFQIAMNKAYTAARERKPSYEVGQKARDAERGFPMTNFGELKYTTWGGGLPVMVEGEVIGAVAVSGLPEKEDMEIAELGRQAALGF